MVGLGGGIVAVQKQSSTNWSHSRGTAGGHRGHSRVVPQQVGVGVTWGWVGWGSEMETLKLGGSSFRGRHN